MNAPSPFEQLVAVMETLRGEGGCPWDRKQDHHTLKRFLQEEAYEVLEAIDSEDPARLREELGDLLLQVVFHAQIAREAGRFDVDDVCRGIVEKMVRRHPHVFASGGARTAAGGDGVPATPEDVVQRWEEIKLAEKGGARRESLLDGIPRDLPALLRAQRVAGRAAEVGFRWPSTDHALAKVREELAEVEEALPTGGAHLEAEIGDLLFAVVSLAATAGVDAESSLRRLTRRFTERFRRMEGSFDGHLSAATPEQLLQAWREASESA